MTPSASAPVAALLDRRVAAPRQVGVGRRHRAGRFGVAAASVAAGCVLVGRAGCGFDSSWALVWAGDALHGRVAAQPSAVVLPTPHPASLLWATLVRVAPPSAGRTVWALSIEVVLVALLFGVFVLGARVGGRLAGCVSVLLVSAVPALGDAVTSGTVDVLFAAAVVWSLILAAARPGWALALATAAALSRPEGAVLLGLIAAWRWRGAGARFRVGAVMAAVGAVAAWLLMGTMLFADPLIAVHVTLANATAGHDRVGLGSFVRALLVGGGWVAVVVVVSAMTYALFMGRKSPQIVLGAAASVGMAIALAVISANGAAVPSRYFAAELACAVPIGIGAICAVPKRRYTQWAAWLAVGGLGVVVLMTSLGPRSARASAAASQGRELTTLGEVLGADQRCGAVSVAPHVFVPVVVLDARRPVIVSPSAAGDSGVSCRLAARDPLTATGDGWGPEPATVRLETVPTLADVIATNTDWVLYVS